MHCAYCGRMGRGLADPVNERPSYHLIEQGNGVAGADWAWLHYARVESAEGPARGRRVAVIHLRVVHCFLNSWSVDAELAAGGAGFGEFDDGLSDAPALAWAPLFAVDAYGGDIFA